MQTDTGLPAEEKKRQIDAIVTQAVVDMRIVLLSKSLIANTRQSLASKGVLPVNIVKYSGEPEKLFFIDMLTREELQIIRQSGDDLFSAAVKRSIRSRFLYGSCLLQTLCNSIQS